MTKATKQKLATLTQTIEGLNFEQQKKQKTIIFLGIGIVGVVLILALVFLRRRKK